MLHLRGLRWNCVLCHVSIGGIIMNRIVLLEHMYAGKSGDKAYGPLHLQLCLAQVVRCGTCTLHFFSILHSFFHSSNSSSKCSFSAFILFLKFFPHLQHTISQVGQSPGLNLLLPSSSGNSSNFTKNDV
jgi:hypothetical protein